MFVFEALLLTFCTTPLVTVLYPPERRIRVTAAGGNYSNAADTMGEMPQDKKSALDTKNELDRPWKTRFTVVLDKIEHLPGMMALTQLIIPTQPSDISSSKPGSLSGGQGLSGASQDLTPRSPDVFIDAFRLIELSDRTSAVMKGSATDSLLQTDPLLGIFRMFGELHDLDVSSSLSIVMYDDLSSSVAEQASNNASQLILLPWLPPSVPSNDYQGKDTPGNMTPRAVAHTTNPFETLFGSKSEKSVSAIHSHFVRGVFSQAKTDVALFIDRGPVPGEARTNGSTQHIYLPFVGGPDDRLALDLVIQLCANPKISATIVRVKKQDVVVDLERPAAVHTTADIQAVQEAAANLRDHGISVISVS